MNPVRIKVAEECMESMETIESLPLLSPLSPNKTHTLVLDIDETLLSVRRWIDEVQINDKVLYNKSNKKLNIIKITKEVTLQYDDGALNVYSFYFDPEHPFAQLSSALDIGDRMDIGGRLASVKEVFTSYVTINDEDTNSEMEINCMNDEYLHKLQYVATNARDGKFSQPDLVYSNMYLVRFRQGLDTFFNSITSYPNLEIVLWTAAVRKVYTGLMQQVHDILMTKMVSPSTECLWSAILFRDNCSCRENGSYFKDLSKLNRDMSRVVMVDNISFNFEGYEMNGLPINEYWGHAMDEELPKLTNILHDILSAKSSECDVRRILHRYAFQHDFSSLKLDQMVRYLAHHDMESSTKNMTLDDMESLFDEDEVMEIEDFSPASSQSNNEEESEDSGSDSEQYINHDSTPTSVNVSELLSSQSNSMDETDDKHLDFYLFNLSMDLMNDEDDDFFNDVDPTLLFNEHYP